MTQRRDARCAPRRKLRFRKSERASSSSATSRRQRSASICMAVLLQSSNEDNTAAAYARLDRDNGGIRSAEAQPMSCAKARSQDSSGCLLSSSRIWAARSSGSAISAACCQAKEREHLDICAFGKGAACSVRVVGVLGSCPWWGGPEGSNPSISAMISQISSDYEKRSQKSAYPQMYPQTSFRCGWAP